MHHSRIPAINNNSFVSMFHVGSTEHFWFELSFTVPRRPTQYALLHTSNINDATIGMLYVRIYLTIDQFCRK